METSIVVIRPETEEEDIKRAGDILKRGGLVAFPTETVYGLGGNALDAEASARIYAAKGRPSDNPLIVHIAAIEDLYGITEEVSGKAGLLAEAFWPGPLTMIFKKNEKVPYSTTGGLDTVAVRFPGHEIARKVIKAGGGYVAAPSANTSGRPSPTEAAHVIEDLSGKIDMIVDGGSVGIGLESTIVDMSVDEPVILRPGYISQQMIEDVIGPVKMDAALLSADSKARPKAPGMKYKHYAPKADLVIVEGDPEKVINRISRLAEEAQADGRTVGIICTEETVERYKTGIVKSAGTRSSEITIAQHLYGILREFDELEVSQIYSEAFDTPKMGEAIMNRLIKAAGHQIMKV